MANRIRSISGGAAKLGLVLAALLEGGCGSAGGADYEAVDSLENALEGGTVLSATAIGKLGFAKVFGVLGCSGAVLSASSFWNKSYVLTAGHCVTQGVRGTATVVVNGISYTNGVTIPHPSFVGQVSYDIALIEIPSAVEVLDPSGNVLQEYRRPVYVGNVNSITLQAGLLVGAGRNDGAPDELPCTNGTGANDLSVRFAEYPSLRNGDPDVLAVPASELLPTGSEMHKGDSGGPWLFSDGGPNAGLTSYTEDGVVVGQSSRIFCQDIGRHEAQAISTQSALTVQFLENTMGDLLVTVDETQIPWSRNGCWGAWDCVYGPVEKAAALVPTPIW